MADQLVTLFSLAGFLLGQVLSVSTDVPKRTLTPVAFVVTEADQRFMFFEGDTLTAMVENGRRELTSGRYEAWAFAYEAFVRIGNERKSVVLVQAWMQGVNDGITIAQPLNRGDDGHVEAVGPPFLMSSFDPSDAEKRTTVTPLALTTEQEEAIEQGI